MWFTRVSINNPIFATMVMLALIVVGVVSFNRLNVKQLPDINLPTIVITAEYPNASPMAVEQDVTNKIEEAVNTIGGIDTLKSRSYLGRAVVIVFFDLDTDATADIEEVRERLSTIQGDFKDEVKTPEVRQVDPDAQPVLSLSISSDSLDLKALSGLANNVVIKRLQDVAGVGDAYVIGDQERQVNINIDAQRLNAYRLTVNDIVTAVESDNQVFPVGSIKKSSSETNIQVNAEMRKIVDFNKLIVAHRNGEPIYLRQVASIEDGKAKQESAALIDGIPSVTLDIVKTNDANTINVAKRLKKKIAALKKDLPQGVELRLIKDNASQIVASVNNVKETILEGALLTILVVFLFLSSWRSTVITSLTLPVSVIGTFAVMYALGFSLNNLTLMALSLVIGILIDDAIVVRENISRHILMGKSHRQAALEGTKEIGLAVFATTLTLVAVFLPVAFMQGIIGRFFYQFGVTVAVSVLISLFVSYTIDPMLSSLWTDPHLKIDQQPRWLARFSSWREAKLEAFTDNYQRLLAWCLQHRIKTLSLTLALFFSSFVLLGFIGKEFIPTADLGEITVSIKGPEGVSLDYTMNKVRQIQSVLKAIPDVKYSYASINSYMAHGYNNAVIFAELVDKKDRRYNGQALLKYIRSKVSHMAGLEVMVSLGDSSGHGQRSIQVSIQGDSLTTLTELSKTVENMMKSTDGFVDIDSSLDVGKPVIDVNLKRTIASDLGICLSDVYSLLFPLFSGKTVGTWLGPDDNNYDVVVQLPDEKRRGLDDIKQLYIASRTLDPSGNPVMVPLSQVVEMKRGTTASEIYHRNMRREVVVSANVSGHSEGDLAMAFYKRLGQLKLPKGYHTVAAGNAKNMNESAGYAASALLMAVIFIYMILASQFASFTQPLIIMASLPLSLIGVFIALFVTGSTLNMFSVIGCIMLMGLVTKNAILLIDFINIANRRGESRIDAIMQAGRVRMRPILMTTTAMIFGMLPLALGIGEGAEQRMSMAQAIIGGLITSTLLTLIVIPVTYSLIEDIKAWFGQKLGKTWSVSSS